MSKMSTMTNGTMSVNAYSQKGSVPDVPNSHAVMGQPL